MGHHSWLYRWSLLSALMVPSVALAQTGPFDGGVAQSDEAVEMPRLRALGTLLTHISTPELMLADCFRECFARDPGARADVCASEPNPATCLNQADIPACIVARRTSLVGVNILTAASCSSSSAAPAARVTSALSSEEVARRQRRREAAMRDCAGQERFVNACVACTSSFRGNTWLSANTERARNIILVAIRGSSSPYEAEASFRCVSPPMRAYNNLLAATRADVTALETRVGEVTQQVASLQMGGGSNGFSPDVAHALADIIDTLGFERASHEYERATMDVHVCEMISLPAALPGEDRGRNLAPADMALWPAEDVRRRGFRPRTPPSSTRCSSEHDRVAIARTQLDRYENRPGHASISRLSSLAVFLGAITERCQGEPSELCSAAHENLRSFLNGGPSQAPNRPSVDRSDESVAANSP